MGLNIVTASNLEASLAYYANPRMASSFYDLRPLAGAVTHWNYAGQPKARLPAVPRRHRERRLPEDWPGGDGRKTRYDPSNQITS